MPGERCGALSTDADPRSVYAEALGLLARGATAEARQCLEAALAAKGGEGRLLLALAAVERAEGHLDRAVARLVEAVAAMPGEPSILNNLGLALLEVGRSRDAMARFRQALTLRPDDAEIHSNLIFALDADPKADVVVQQRERRRWFERHAAEFSKEPRAISNSRDPDRRLRIGYVSADFCRHSAAAIFGPIVLGHDSGRFECACYSATRQEDEATETFRQRVSIWRDISGQSDDDVARAIFSDGIDILVDLSGHSGGGRLGVFARKPAPIQISAWGHATGTGLPMIDALFADAVVVPAEERRFYAEAVVDLPCLLTFDAPREPAISPEPPSVHSDAVVFGSFNRFAKLSNDVLGCWAKLVLGYPGARLLLKDAGLDDPDLRARVQGVLAQAGLPATRVSLRGRSDRARHLAAYGEVDVALDPFPMNGGLSTLEALWMGVPVVTLRGRSISARGCASILTAIGEPSWMAADEAGYGAIAHRLARDVAMRRAFRATIRERMSAHPIGNPTLYCRAVEDVYRRLWRGWCASG